MRTTLPRLSRRVLLEHLDIRKREQSKLFLAPAVSHFIFSLLQVIIGGIGVLLDSLQQLFVG